MLLPFLPGLAQRIALCPWVFQDHRGSWTGCYKDNLLRGNLQLIYPGPRLSSLPSEPLAKKNYSLIGQLWCKASPRQDSCLHPWYSAMNKVSLASNELMSLARRHGKKQGPVGTGTQPVPAIQKEFNSINIPQGADLGTGSPRFAEWLYAL